MLHCFMLHYLNDALVVVTLFGAAHFDVALFTAALLNVALC